MRLRACGKGTKGRSEPMIIRLTGGRFARRYEEVKYWWERNAPTTHSDCSIMRAVSSCHMTP
jgi:hypothetical protein